MQRLIVLLAVMQAVAGCGRSDSPVLSLTPTPLPPFTQSLPAPAPPRAEPPAVYRVVPAVGSTAGLTPITIEGAGFVSGARVTFGDVPSHWAPWFLSDAKLLATSPAHAAGPVDIIVTNPDGQTTTLARAYTYASPDSFDFNGTWEGAAGPEVWEYTLRFTIENKRVVNVACGASGDMTLSPAPLITDGEFSFVSSDGVSMSGRIVASSMAKGTINLPSCGAVQWFATKHITD